jgi:hypothetical protein
MIEALTPNGYYVAFDGWGNREEVCSYFRKDNIFLLLKNIDENGLSNYSCEELLICMFIFSLKSSLINK